MGDRNFDFSEFLPTQFDPDGSKALAHAEETGRARAEALIKAEKIEADAQAARYLAEMNCPPDLVEFGINHGIPTFAGVTWMSGFVQGWRMACSRSARKS